MPVAGIEPARHCWQWILSPPRLPVPTHRHSELIIYQARRFFKPGYKGRNILLDILPPQCYYNRANARVVELADSLDSGSSVHYARAGSSPASRTSVGTEFTLFRRLFLPAPAAQESAGPRHVIAQQKTKPKPSAAGPVLRRGTEAAEWMTFFAAGKK